MLPLHFGLGSATRVDGIEIRWPNGDVQHLDGDQLTSLMKDKRQIQITEPSAVAPGQSLVKAP